MSLSRLGRLRNSLGPGQTVSAARDQAGRRPLKLFALWLLAAVSLGYVRWTHPAFGLQGDLPLHYHLVRSFARSLAEGEWLPRWAGLLDGGRGDAFFTFYPPLCYWITGGLAVGGVDILAALKCVSLLSALLAQVSAYLLAREFFDPKRSALAALTYVLLPAYALIALNRNFLANALALGVLPLAVLGAHLLLTGERRGKGAALFALGFGAVMLTHAITAYLCALTIGLMALCYLPLVGWRGGLRLLVGGLLALALTAFFWVPQLVEMNWAQVSLEVVNQDYRNYFLFAAPASASHYRQAWADFNYVASLMTLAQTAFGFLLCLVCLRTPSRLPVARLVWLSFVLTLVGLVISLPVSEIVWRHLPGMQFIQFPWRFQPFVALGGAILVGASGDGWGRIGRHWRAALAALLTWVVVANLMLTFLAVQSKGPSPPRAEVANLLRPQSAPPLTPEQGARLREEDELRSLLYAANQVYFRPREAEPMLYPPADQVGGLTLIAGHGRITAQKLGISHREFRLTNEEPARVRAETYHYPNWVARLDGHPVRIEAEQGSGLMLIDLPPGEHTLTLDFEMPNPFERWARIVSAATWLLLIGWVGWRRAARFLLDQYRER